MTVQQSGAWPYLFRLTGAEYGSFVACFCACTTDRWWRLYVIGLSVRVCVCVCASR